MQDLENIYRDLHAHPELAFTEHRTAGIAARIMTDLGLEVSAGVGGTGVVAVLRNGDGPVVYLRADMDALPVEEQTGLPYASTERAPDAQGVEGPVMHACGHDMHVTCLIGAVEHLASVRSEWSGTLVALFQPAEEVLGGARAMVADNLAERFPAPDIVLGQHVISLPVGVVALHAGTTMAGSDGVDITFTGRGGHGSRPETTIDPIVTASAAVLRLQTVVSREVEPGTLAVVTVGRFAGGTKSNIIPETATLGLSVRSVDAGTRERLLAAVERIAKGEALTSGMTVEPTITHLQHGDPAVNDPDASERLRRRFTEEWGQSAVIDWGVTPGTEDVGELAKPNAAPLVFWFFGGFDSDAYASAVAAGTVDSTIPSNHSPYFAPLVQPTISQGVRNLVVAALEWLTP